MNDARWLSQFLESLRQLGDRDAQRDAWIGLKRPNFPSPEELICQVFDDSGLDDLLSIGPVFSPKVDAVLRELSDVAAVFVPASTAADIDADERWAKIVALARRALFAIEHSLSGAAS